MSVIRGGLNPESVKMQSQATYSSLYPEKQLASLYVTFFGLSLTMTLSILFQFLFHSCSPCYVPLSFTQLFFSCKCYWSVIFAVGCFLMYFLIILTSDFCT